MVDGVLARDASHPLQIHVSKRLRDFELRVAIDSPHERIVLFGPSGSGKTTMLQLVAGTMRPDDGRVEVGGETLFSSELAVNIPARRRGVGYVPQGNALFPHLDVAENVAFGLQKLTRAERATRVAELLRLVNLEDVRSERPARLSGGQQQRTAIARALAPYPRILLLDEPFSSLDGILRSRLRDDIIELQQSLGVPLVTVTHDLTDAFRLAQWFVVLDRGTVLQQGPANDVFFRPATVQVARLVGVRNVLDARVVRSERAEVEVEWNGYLLRSEQGEVASKWTPSVGDRVAICIRPNQLMIRLAQRSYEGRPNVINGSIVDKVLGAENHRLFVRVSGSEAAHDLEVELPGYAYHRLELDGRKDIELSIRPNLLHVIPAD